MNEKRRNSDRWWYKAIEGMVLGFITVSVGMTVYVFSNFARIKYVDAENNKQDQFLEERMKREEEKQKNINMKLDFLVQNIGRNSEEIKENRRRLEEKIGRR